MLETLGNKASSSSYESSSLRGLLPLISFVFPVFVILYTIYYVILKRFAHGLIS